jgi:hypothetical protein
MSQAAAARMRRYRARKRLVRTVQECLAKGIDVEQVVIDTIREYDREHARPDDSAPDTLHIEDQ